MANFMFQLTLSQSCQWLLTAGVSVKDRRYITALVTRQSWYRNLFLAFKLYNWTRTSPIYPIIIHSSVHVPLLCSYAKNFLSKRQLVSSLYLLSVKKRLVPTIRLLFTDSDFIFYIYKCTTIFPNLHAYHACLSVPLLIICTMWYQYLIIGVQVK